MDMDWTPFLNLVQSGGPVLIAVVVLSALVYLGYRFIMAPAQKQSRAIAESNREAAHQNALAATAHEGASRANAETSQANARTAAHLERLTEMLLGAAIKARL